VFAQISAFLSGEIFNCLGRKKGFVIGAGAQSVAGVMAICAMESRSPGWLLAASIFVGFGQGMGNFLRFSAAEMVPSNWSAQGITYVMISGVVACMVGPLSGTVLQDVLPTKFMGSFIVYLTFAVLNLITLMLSDFTPYPVQHKREQQKPAEKQRAALGGGGSGTGATPVAAKRPHHQHPVRNLSDVVRGKMFIFSVAVATAAQLSMIVPMQSLEVAMTKQYDFTFPQSSAVMILHILASFAFGPVAGFLLYNFSTVAVVGMSVAFNVLAYSLLLNSTSLFAFTFGMILVGSSWNLGYSAGSVMLLCTCYADEDRLLKQVQATNDTIMLSITAVVTIFAGVEEGKKDGGWHSVLYFGGVFVLLQAICAVVIWQYKSSIAPLFRDGEENLADIRSTFSSEDIVRRTSMMASHFVFTPAETSKMQKESKARCSTLIGIPQHGSGGQDRVSSIPSVPGSFDITSSTGSAVFVANPMRP